MALGGRGTHRRCHSGLKHKKGDNKREKIFKERKNVWSNCKENLKVIRLNVCNRGIFYREKKGGEFILIWITANYFTQNILQCAVDL
jgi:hypothetical protein